MSGMPGSPGHTACELLASVQTGPGGAWDAGSEEDIHRESDEYSEPGPHKGLPLSKY